MWKGRADSSRRRSHLPQGWKLSWGSGRLGKQPKPTSLLDVPDDKSRNVPPEASLDTSTAVVSDDEYGRHYAGGFIEARALSSSSGRSSQRGKSLNESGDDDLSTDSSDSMASIDDSTTDDEYGRHYAGGFIEARALSSSSGRSSQRGKSMNESGDDDPSTDSNDSMASIDDSTPGDDTMLVVSSSLSREETIGTSTSQVSVRKIEGSNQSQSPGGPVATIAGEVGGNVVREAMPMMGTCRVELAGKNDLELSEEAEDEVDDEFWVAASNITGIRETQPLGGPKYYVVSNTNMGKARIVHQAMPTMMDALNVAVVEESGFEVIEYALHTREIRVEKEECFMCDMGGFMSPIRYVKVVGDIVACGCSGGGDIVNSNDSIVAIASRDRDRDAFTDADMGGFMSPIRYVKVVCDIVACERSGGGDIVNSNDSIVAIASRDRDRDAFTDADMGGFMSPIRYVKVVCDIVACECSGGGDIVNSNDSIVAIASRDRDRDAFIDAPAFSEPDDESLDVTDIFLKDPTQTENAPLKYRHETDENRSISRDDCADALAIQELDNESCEVIEASLGDAKQIGNAPRYLLETLKDDSEFLSLANAEMAAEEEVSSEAEDYPKLDAPILRAVSTVKPAVNSPTLKHIRHVKKRVQIKSLLDILNESRPNRPVKKHDKRFHQVKDVGLNQSAIAVQEPFDKWSEVLLDGIINPTQAEDARYDLVHQLSDNSAKSSKSQLSKYISSFRSVIKTKKNLTNVVPKQIVETNSPGDTAKKRREKIKNKRGKPDPVPLMQADEIMLHKGIVSELQGKINNVDQLENNVYHTGCCNEFLESFAPCSGVDDGSTVTKTSSNSTESINGGFSSTYDESTDRVNFSFSVCT
jgi:hypothetical protein